MRQTLVGFAGFAAALLALAPAEAQQTIKIGVIMPYSGQFADPGAQIDNGIKLYMKQHGDTVAGKKIEIIRKDTGGIAPDVAKRLAQELVVRDKVDMLAGFALTPNALAAADVSAQAKKFMVVMNAATSIITTKSPYMVRTSFTLPQLNEPLGSLGVQERRAEGLHAWWRTLRPGHDAEAAFQGLQGGRRRDRRLGALSRSPIPDFSAFVQRAKDSEPGGDLHLRARRPAAARRSARRWPSAASTRDKTKVLAPGRTDRRASAEEHGRYRRSASSPPSHYDYNHNSKLNKAFVAAYNAAFKRNPDISSRSAAMTACT